MARIAIIGTGIAGLSAAHRLFQAGQHDLTLFEAGAHVGGHTATVDVLGHAVDTGFIVNNELTYPRFTALLAELRVDTRPSTMSFGVRDDATGIEYAATNLASVFAQPRNLLDRRHWGMLAEIVRFNRVARSLLDSDDHTTTLDAYLARQRFSATFRDRFLVPMAAAIWSAPPGQIGQFPARTLVEFFANHRFLDLWRRPQWRTITGGSRQYVRRLIRPFADRIRLRTPVERVRRRDGGVEIAVAAGVERYDHVVLACHSDQAMRLLADATPVERAVVGSIAYQHNDVTLHTDTSLLPRARRAWAAWNYHVHAESARPATVTYDMSLLQGIVDRERFLVTLNEPDAVDLAKVLGRYTYDHPVFTAATHVAQQRWREVCPPTGRTWFAGAYWFYGCHEDGVRSGYRAADAVVAALGARLAAVA